jgi:hypothetical protein
VVGSCKTEFAKAGNAEGGGFGVGVGTRVGIALDFKKDTGTLGFDGGGTEGACDAEVGSCGAEFDLERTVRA